MRFPLLLASGATIHEINAVRKHISRIKGGQLARMAHPARVLALILSDVIGDDLDVIGILEQRDREATQYGSGRVGEVLAELRRELRRARAIVRGQHTSRDGEEPAAEGRTLPAKIRHRAEGVHEGL